MRSRQLTILSAILIAATFTSCGHSLKRERIYGQNGWRVGPYEIILHPKFATDSIGEMDKSRITEGLFTISQVPERLDGSGRTSLEIEIDSLSISYSGGSIKNLALKQDPDSSYSNRPNLIAATRFRFDWGGLEPLANGSRLKYILRLRDTVTGEVLYHASLEENFRTNAWSQKYPNPFCPQPTIDFQMPNTGEYSLTIYNIKGEVVATFNGTGLEGELMKIEWQAVGLDSGVYFYRLTVGDYSITKKLMLIK